MKKILMFLALGFLMASCRDVSSPAQAIQGHWESGGTHLYFDGSTRIRVRNNAETRDGYSIHQVLSGMNAMTMSVGGEKCFYELRDNFDTLRESCGSGADYRAAMAGPGNSYKWAGGRKRP